KDASHHLSQYHLYFTFTQGYSSFFKDDVLRESLRTSTDNADAGSVFRIRPAIYADFGLPAAESFPNRLQLYQLELSMNANPEFFAATAQVDAAAIAPLPKSRKVYEIGSRPDIRVPFREISQDTTPTLFGGE